MAKKKTRAQAPNASHWWDRPQLTVKLSARRLEWMAAVAKAMPAGATPQEVIDHALRTIAAGDGGGLERTDERLSELEAAMAAAEARREAEAAALHARFDGLMALIREAAADPGY